MTSDNAQKFVSWNWLVGTLVSVMIVAFSSWIGYVTIQAMHVPVIESRLTGVETSSREQYNLINKKLDAIGERLNISLPNQ